MQMEQPPIGLWRWAMDAIQKIDGGDVWTPNGIIRVEGYPPTRLRGLCTAIKTTLDEAETDAPTSVADDQILMVPYDRAPGDPDAQHRLHHRYPDAVAQSGPQRGRGGLEIDRGRDHRCLDRDERKARRGRDRR